MNFDAILAVISLSDPPPNSVINTASSFLSALLFGPIATAIAVIATAWVGFAMLSGRVNVRRGLSVILGCFILFGARGIADGLRNAAISSTPESVSAPPPPTYVRSIPAGSESNGYDPYAGAAVTRPAQ